MSIGRIKTLTPRHHRILDMFLQGYTNDQIAKQLDMPARSISVIFNSPTFQNQLALRRMRLEDKLDEKLSGTFEDVNEKLKQHALEAAEKVGMLINSDDESIALRSAQDILDRTGHPKQIKADNTNMSAILVLTPEDVNRIEQSIILDSAPLDSNTDSDEIN